VPKRIPLPLALALAFVCAAVAPEARAALTVIKGGTTTLTSTVDTSALDVTETPLGATTTSSPGVFSLPITSGAVDLAVPAGSAHHDGSGIEFTIQGVSVDVENMEFDFDQGQVQADLSAGPFELSTGVFDIKSCAAGGCMGSSSGFGLFLRAQAADFFENDVFHSRHFDDGDQIFHADLHPTFGAPEPGILTLLGVGLAVVAVLAPRRRPPS
jgi:hypothetical protein